MPLLAEVLIIVKKPLNNYSSSSESSEIVFVHFPLLEHAVQAVRTGTQPKGSLEQSVVVQDVLSFTNRFASSKLTEKVDLQFDPSKTR